MMRRKRRAYLITLAILGALGGMAYYANWQSKQFSWNQEGTDHLSGIKNQAEPMPVPPPPTPNPVPTATEPQPTPKAPLPQQEKSKSYIIQLDQYGTSLDTISVPKGYRLNLVLKVDSYRSGDGLSFKSPDQPEVFIKSGQNKSLTFKPESDFKIEVYLGETKVKTPYTLNVKVE